VSTIFHCFAENFGEKQGKKWEKPVIEGGKGKQDEKRVLD